MDRTDRYILEGKTAVQCPDLHQWASWMEKDKRRVGKTKVGETEISTVFLGLDHSFEDSPYTILFETLIFGGKLNQQGERYSTWEEAEIGHEKWVVKVSRLDEED